MRYAVKTLVASAALLMTALVSSAQTADTLGMANGAAAGGAGDIGAAAGHVAPVR